MGEIYSIKVSCQICGAECFTKNGLGRSKTINAWTTTERAIALTKVYCPNDTKHFGMTMTILDSSQIQISINDLIFKSSSQSSTDTITT